MDWNAFWMERDAAIREYEERTFADYIDGGYDMNANDEEDVWNDEWRDFGQCEYETGWVWIQRQ